MANGNGSHSGNGTVRFKLASLVEWGFRAIMAGFIIYWTFFNNGINTNAQGIDTNSDKIALNVAEDKLINQKVDTFMGTTNEKLDDLGDDMEQVLGILLKRSNQ